MTTAQESAAVAGALALLAATFAAGRYSAPGPDVHTVDDSVVVHTVTSVTKTAHDAVQDSHQVRVVYRERLPNGTQTETERVTIDTHTEEHDRTDAAVAVADTATAHHDQTVTAYRPEWHVGALLGASWQPGSLPALEVGAQAQKRVLGPFVGGLWLLVRPPLNPATPLGIAAGGSISVEF